MSKTPSLRITPIEAAQSQWDAQTPIRPELFVDPEIYQAEIERIFHGPYWHMVGHVSEFPNDGDYKTHRLGQVPIIVTRKGDDFHILINSCAHRGAQVVRGSRGTAKGPVAFTCVYHQWGYNAKGEVTGVGRRQGYPDDFPVKEFCLPRGKAAVVGGVIFASLGKEPPAIEDYLGEKMIGYIERLYGAPDLKYLGVQRAVFQCNWKLYVENIYDSYHAVTLHKGFRLMRIRKAAPQLNDPNILRYGHYLSEYEAEIPERVDLYNPEIFEMRSRNDGVSGHVIANIFPACQMAEQLDVLAIREVIPRGPDATEIQFHVYGRESDDAALREHKLWQAANFLGPQGLINLEDAAALARVQTSLQGRGRSFDGRGGRRFPARRDDEKALDNFYGAYRRAMFDEPVAGGN